MLVCCREAWHQFLPACVLSSSNLKLLTSEFRTCYSAMPKKWWKARIFGVLRPTVQPPRQATCASICSKCGSRLMALPDDSAGWTLWIQISPACACKSHLQLGAINAFFFNVRNHLCTYRESICLWFGFLIYSEIPSYLESKFELILINRPAGDFRGVQIRISCH